MPDAPLADQWIDLTRAVALGGVGMIGLFMIAGLAAYAILCWRSRRQWDGVDQRWTLPR